MLCREECVEAAHVLKPPGVGAGEGSEGLRSVGVSLFQLQCRSGGVGVDCGGGGGARGVSLFQQRQRGVLELIVEGWGWEVGGHPANAHDARFSCARGLFLGGRGGRDAVRVQVQEAVGE